MKVLFRGRERCFENWENIVIFKLGLDGGVFRNEYFLGSYVCGYFNGSGDEVVSFFVVDIDLVIEE